MNMRPTIMQLVVLLVLILFTSVLPTQAQTPSPTPIPRKWDEESRFTVLVAGLDRRPGRSSTLQVRTDAIMLVSFYPETESIGVLHIPRDLFFALPPLENDVTLPLVRVNTLLLNGEQQEAGYGAYFMMDTLQYNFGMYIDAYILFDFEAFTTIVDAVGGIDITTTYTINDPTYPNMNYGYDPFYLRAGEHHLDGKTALKYARTRHGDNDYVRGVRQLQVLRAVGERATSVEVLPSLLVEAPALLEELQNELYTDIGVEDGIALGLYAAQLPLENIRTAALNQQYITYTINEGDTVAIPDREKLGELLIDVFGEDYAG